MIDDTILLIPDRLGNNRIDTLANLVVRPGIGLIFFVPGINETLRINGKSCITTDRATLKPLAVNDKVPQSAILVTAEEIYIHCGKALIRSDLWNPDKLVRRGFSVARPHPRRSTAYQCRVERYTAEGPPLLTRSKLGARHDIGRCEPV